MTVNATRPHTVTISASTNNICPGTPVTFTAIPINGGATPAYVWRVNGVVVGNNSQTFTSSALNNGDQVNVTVRSSVLCASPLDAVSNTVTMNVRPGSPVTPGLISGQVHECPNTTGIIYSITSVPDATVYNWTVPSGWIITSGQGTIAINVTSGNFGQNGNISVNASNSCGNSPASVLPVTVDPGTPATPGAISGANPACPGTINLYSITDVPNATSYTWSVPSGWNIISGQGTSSISVTSGSVGQDGTITVSAGNSCGTSGLRTLALTVGSLSDPPTGVSISDNNTCYGINKTLTVTGGTLGTGAVWRWYTGSCGGTLAGTGSSITVNPTAGTTTTYFVRAEGTCNNTDCASGDVVVSPAVPVTAGPITGNVAPCPEVTGLTYTITPVADATTYLWTVPTGWTITGGNGTTSITVTSGNYGQIGNITVSASNSCGTGSPVNLPVTILPGIPAIPGIIIGRTEQCINKTGLVYSVTPVPNATSYGWTVPPGWSITGGNGTNSITVSTGGGALSGNITVNASNSCGTSGLQTLSVIVNTNIPVITGSITGPTAVCPVVTGLSYSINPVPNATDYLWTVPAGWSITNGQGLTSITATAGSTAANGTISVTANNSCGPGTSISISVTVGTFAYASAGPDQTICAGTTSITLQGEIGGVITKNSEWDWSSSVAGGTFSNGGNNLTGTYTLPPSVINGGSVTITIFTIDPPGGCPAISDQMLVTIKPLPSADIIVSGTNPICSGSSTSLTVTATPNTTVIYNINGGVNQTLIIDNSGTAVLNTANLTANTTYRLVSVAYNTAPACSQVLTASATITVNPSATANAGPDQAVCSSSPVVTLAGSIGGAATLGTWTGGTGTFDPNNTTLNATYTPTAAEIATGHVILTLTTDDPAGPCGPFSDDITITINTAVVVNAGTDQTICAGTTALLAGSITGGTTSGSWIGGSGTFNPSRDDMNTVYTPSASEVTAGTVTLTLTSSDPTGPCGVVSDPVTITIHPAVITNAGPDQTICGGSTVQLAGSISGGANSGIWSGGSGTLSPDENTLNAVYTPSAAETAAGSVTLTLTSADPAGPCDPVSDNITITINTQPVIDAGTYQPICAGTSINLAGSIGGSATSGNWTGGTGTFAPNRNTLNASYTPSPAEITAGTVTLTLTTNDPAGVCIAVSDYAIITINPLATVNAGDDQTICSSGSASLNGSVGGGASSGSWSGGSGSFTPSNTVLTAIYTPTEEEIAAGIVTLTLTTNDPDGPCGPVSTTMTITIRDEVIITTQPSNTGVCVTNPVTLSIVAIGDDLTYQWYKVTSTGDVAINNTSNISGAQSPNLHFTQAGTSDIGTYYVVVSGNAECAPVTSETATLNVDEVITVDQQPQSIPRCIGQTATFTISARPSGEILFQWRKNGVDIPGAKSSHIYH